MLSAFLFHLVFPLIILFPLLRVPTRDLSIFQEYTTTTTHVYSKIYQKEKIVYLALVYLQPPKYLLHQTNNTVTQNHHQQHADDRLAIPLNFTIQFKQQVPTTYHFILQPVPSESAWTYLDTPYIRDPNHSSPTFFTTLVVVFW